MPRYHYNATDTEGNQFDGQLDRETLAEAIADLESKGWAVGSIELIQESDIPAGRAGAGRVTSPQFARTSDVGNRLQSYFDSVVAQREQLLPPLEALTAELPRGTGRRELLELINVLKNCHSGSELGRSKHATRWLPLLLSGLTQESASQRLGDLLAITARESRNRSERRRVLAYPAALFLITFLVFALTCAIIVPAFRTMFEEFGLRLPAPTLLVMNISRLFTEQLVSTLISLGVAAVVLYIVGRLWIRSALTTRIFGRLVAGNASSIGAMSSLISQLNDLLNIGLSLPDALWLAGEGCDHRFYQQAAEDLARHAYDSNQPLQASAAAERLPGNLIHALTAGPGGSPHLPLLHELGAIYADHASHRTSWMTGAMAQFSIVLLGFAIGFLVIALFAPLVTLVSGLT